MKVIGAELYSWCVLFVFEGGYSCYKYYSGREVWFDKTGQFHRENGKPAIIHADGTKEWWVNGNHIRTENLGA